MAIKINNKKHYKTCLRRAGVKELLYLTGNEGHSFYFCTIKLGQ